MKALPRAGITKVYRPSLCALGYQNFCVRRPRLLPITYVAVSIPPDVTENNTENGHADNAEAETEFFSSQAVVADYQYALRFYRALKQQVGSWQSAFAKTRGRQPTAADAEEQHGHEFALLYSSLLEVRTRLLVELPRIKARLLEGQEAGGHAPHPKHGGERGSVNANSRAPGSVELAAHSHQQADSVSSWLRADRYRRQRAVTAPTAATRGGVPATAAAPQSRPQPDSPALVGSAPADTVVPPGPVMSAGQPFVQSAGMEAGVLMGQSAAAPAAAPAAAGGAGLGHGQERAPYQPVIQLTPLSHRLREVAGGVQQQGRANGGALAPAEHMAVTADGEAGTGASCSSGSELALEESRFAAEPRWAPCGQQQQPDQQQGAPDRAASWDGSQGGRPSTAAAVQRARVAPGPHTSRLAEDANLSADSRTKNALLAAAQYKRSGRPAGSSPQARTRSRPEGLDGHGEEGRVTSPGSAAGNAEAGEGGAAAVAVVGEVQRGNAVGAYAGRNRRADALPESFMVCP